MRALLLTVLLAACMAASSTDSELRVADFTPPERHGGHRGSVLFLGRAASDQLVPAGSSGATATAAIIVERGQGQIRYDITYSGLESGRATRIGLYNRGAGGNGAALVILCGGENAPACPTAPSARIAGTADISHSDARLLSEFASGRVYVQIDGAAGAPEIRGQLAANSAMVASRTYLAQLVPSVSGAAGEGTAVLSETFLPDNRVAVQYSVTVAGTGGTPEAVSMAGVATAEPLAMPLSSTAGLANETRLPGVRQRRGGTLHGAYTVRPAERPALVVHALILNARRPTLTVRTSRFPRGELAGELVPIE